MYFIFSPQKIHLVYRGFAENSDLVVRVPHTWRLQRPLA